VRAGISLLADTVRRGKEGRLHGRKQKVKEEESETKREREREPVSEK